MPYDGKSKEVCESSAAHGDAPTERSLAQTAVSEGKTMILGYARVSKGDDQSTAAQRRALAEVGCGRVFEEAASGGRWERPELHRLLDQLRPGDVVMVRKLDRLS